ncbi:hypothetical protein SLEP1_g3950 [Rubroshorea leprosula]|uniref:Uncharacterized protein n=1 Tax=Rubroshorea leprosula TaxID=152421 RepID=A0AAV5HM47_9ROSI|nr:hypothetical protein SLEP1_g3950 [Rubroshorea leprosula]
MDEMLQVVGQAICVRKLMYDGHGTAQLEWGIFNDKEAKTDYFFQLVQTGSFYWAKNIAGLDGFSLSNWCKNPIKCLQIKAKEKDRA